MLVLSYSIDTLLEHAVLGINIVLLLSDINVFNFVVNLLYSVLCSIGYDNVERIDLLDKRNLGVGPRMGLHVSFPLSPIGCILCIFLWLPSFCVCNLVLYLYLINYPNKPVK